VDKQESLPIISSTAYFLEKYKNRLETENVALYNGWYLDRVSHKFYTQCKKH